MNWLATGPARRLEVHFGDRVVPCFAERPGSVHALVAEAAARRPEGEALVCGDTRLSWGQVSQRSSQVGEGLARLGIGAGDRVALLLGNRLEFVLTWFGAAQLGAVIVPLGTRQQSIELAYALNDCAARVLVYEAHLADRVPRPADVPALEHRIVVGGEGQFGFDELLRVSGRDGPIPATVQEEDTAAILYTSGTTGRSNGAMLTHLGIIHSARCSRLAWG